MNKIRILDCTLRDGGRIIDCKFDDQTTLDMANNLSIAGIDIIEVGFLRDHSLVTYNGNSTFFTEVPQINRFIDPSSQTMYVAFIDYKMYDFNLLEPNTAETISGIRVGFTKKQFDNEKDEIIKCLRIVKERGYKLFIQGVNTLAYSDKEMLELIEMVNNVKPYGFGIVDTYGAMYLEDLVHYYNLVDYNLDKDICIDVHSHNNFQSSFAFAQEIIKMADGKRNIILDATLNGMGKCAGNLNTELIVDYLNRKKAKDYDLDLIFDIIDRYLSPIKENHFWGYSIPAFMAGIYKSHPNNVIYLTNKYRLNSKDIKYIISAISEDKRQRYDYDNIERILQEYNSSCYNDAESIKLLKEKLLGKNVVIIAPGKSVVEYSDEIKKKIQLSNSKVISVSYVPEDFNIDFAFFANTVQWEKSMHFDKSKCILTSNIHTYTEDAIIVDYSSLVAEESVLRDNSTIMLLNLLKKIGVKSIYLAGFDGLHRNADNYVNNSFINSGHGLSIEDNNRIIRMLFSEFRNRTKDYIDVKFITPSLYDDID